jgi:hypothetical protein
LWIVLADTKAAADQPLNELALEHVRLIVGALVKQLGL